MLSSSLVMAILLPPGDRAEEVIPGESSVREIMYIPLEV
jgi:hypothetical protein